MKASALRAISAFLSCMSETMVTSPTASPDICSSCLINQLLTNYLQENPRDGGVYIYIGRWERVGETWHGNEIRYTYIPLPKREPLESLFIYIWRKNRHKGDIMAELVLTSCIKEVK